VLDLKSLRIASAFSFIGLLAACVVSPFVFVVVEAGAARLALPALLALGISSHAGISVGLASMSVLGSVIAALVLCFPLGRVAPERPGLFGVIVGVVGAIALLWIWLFPLEEGTALPGLRWLDVTAFAGSCVLFSLLGARAAHRAAA